jgi:hypothetical protein
VSKPPLSNAAKVTAVLAIIAVAAVAWALKSGILDSGIASYYPLQVGNTWSYETLQYGKMVGPTGEQETEKLGTLEQRVIGISPRATDELDIFEVSQKTEESDSATEEGSSVESVLHVSATPSAITLHAIDFDEPDSPVLPGPVPILTDPPAADQVVSQNGSLQMSLGVESQEVEAVEVPAGRFPKALKRYAEGPISGTVSDVPVTSGIVKESTWFVRDVGIVKQERTLEILVGSSEGAQLRMEERTVRALTEFSPGPSD